MNNRFLRIQLSVIVLLAIVCNINAQSNKLNFGLSQPQDPVTLPISVARPESSVRKAKVVVPALLQQMTENEYLLASGWEMAEADKVIGEAQSMFNPNFKTTDWYNATFN